MHQATTTGMGEQRPATSPREGRPQLLFLCQTLPFPPDGGAHIRAYNILRLLARAFDVTALCFYRTATRPTREQVEHGIAGLGELARVEAFPIPQEQHLARLVWDHLRSISRGRAYTRYAYESGPFRERLAALLRSRSFDLVHLESLDLSCYLPLLEGIPVVCGHQNVESELLRRRAASEQSILRSRYIAHQGRLTLQEERDWCPKVDLNVAVSVSDRARFGEIAPDARITVIPNGVDTNAFRPAPGPEGGMVFVGGHSWFPNRDAMLWFCQEILPLMGRGDAAAPLTWVGDAPEHARHEFESYGNVRLTGFVDDIRPHVHRAACYVVPLRVGGGTRLKILDAWAMGKAVVSTSVGCEGLAAEDGENILVRDDPREFAAAVRQVLTDSGLRGRLGNAARATAERIYDWDRIGQKLLREYLSLVRQPLSLEETARLAARPG